MNYFKIAFRVQSKNKWFTLVNVVGLSLGIVCSTIIFLYVNFHITTDTHHNNSDRIYRLVLDIHTPSGTIEHESGAALPMTDALANEYSQLEKTAFCMKFYSPPTITIMSSGREERFKESNVAYADNKFIEVFDYRFISGDRETALINPRSVILSERQALKYFGFKDVLGKSVMINHKTELMVTGVVADPPHNSDLMFDILVSLPTLKIINPAYQDRNFTWIGSNNWLFVRLKQGYSEAELNEQLPSFVKKYLGADFSHWRFHFQPLSDMHFDIRYGGAVKKNILWVLAGVAVALLCIVSINYINLSIAQSYARAKEIGIRKCLGSMRSQLFFQFMLETGIVVMLSLCIAWAGCYLVLPIVNAWMQVELALMQLAMSEIIIYFILFAIGLVALAGYYPAIILSGFDPIKAIAGRQGTVGGHNQMLQKSLIVFQYGIALLFLMSTFIIVGQVDYLLNNDLGFSKEGVITVNVPKSNYATLEAFRNEIETLPGIESVTFQHQAPMSNTADGGFIKYDHRTDWEEFIVRDRWADDKFKDTYSLEILAGRNIMQYDSLTEVLVNETLLKKLDIKETNEIIGKTILFDNSGMTGVVVGVVRDFHHRSLQHQIDALAIYPLRGVFNQAGIKISREGDRQLLAAIERIWKKNFPYDIPDLSFLDQSLAKLYHHEQTTSRLMGIFAGISIVICCMGILALSVFSTFKRTKEIGIRKVLGATVFNIIFMLSRQYLVLTAIAFIIAAPVAFFVMGQWLNQFSYHIPIGWDVFVVPGIAIAMITALLVGAQSLKTALTNPVRSLKHE